MKTTIEDWGSTSYQDALQIQLRTLQERREGKRPDTLVFTEHQPVYTVGRHPKAAKNLIASPTFLHTHGIEVVETNRGGDITYHGPGQITGYLFVDLSQSKDLHQLLRQVEDLVIATVCSFGLAANRRKGLTGVWIDSRKIAAIGMAARHWVSFHGFALNVSTNLEHFSGIVPCGITDGTVTSLEKELGRSVVLDEVKNRLGREFQRAFGTESKN
ncbi:MAG: lipoyl(octanoyl) transferase LipB [Verrucomicrobiota bacterium]